MSIEEMEKITSLEEMQKWPQFVTAYMEALVEGFEELCGEDDEVNTIPAKKVLHMLKEGIKGMDQKGGDGVKHTISDVEMERILQEEPDERKVLEAVRRYRAQREEGEDKDLICQLLGATLKATREHRDLQGLYYQKLDSGDETVTVSWGEGGTTVNVTADSGIAMIRDILQAIK